MKLRNKKTGEIVDDVQYRNFSFADGFGLRTDKRDYNYKTLAKFNEDWEDYTPPEPLIKDEKIRKAVRAWAEANSITQVSHDAGWNAFRCTDFVIAFDHDFDRHDGLEDMKSYTIAELCGEEEE